METYKIYIDVQLIEFKKADADEYEFSAMIDHLDYYGKSFLKGLAFITDFKGYIKTFNTSMTMEFPKDGYIMIRLPLPFSDKFELVELKEVETNETKKLDIFMRRNIDILTRNIQRLESRINELEIENERLKFAQKKYYLFGRFEDAEIHILSASHDDHLKIIKDNLLNLKSDDSYQYRILSALAESNFKATPNTSIDMNIDMDMDIDYTVISL